MSEVDELRCAILAAPMEISNYGEEPSAGTLYIPSSHKKSLQPDVSLVIGGRGVGKSFWAAALGSEKLRELVGVNVPELRDLEIRTGFSTLPAIDKYPNEDIFRALIEEGHDPYNIWRAVILRWVADRNARSIPRQDWLSTLSWLAEKPEEAAALMESSRDWRGLIIFDALDRTSTDWKRMDDILRGLLRTVLWLKSFRGLYAKVFLRADQSKRTILNFPDSSKLSANKAELTWEKHDLHGLLWQRLINAPNEHGQLMQSLCRAVDPSSVREIAGGWQLQGGLKAEKQLQMAAFAKLAGDRMGRDVRRGIPYSWSVGHLADGLGYASPRSFLAAIHEAAADSSVRYAGHTYPLHFESIKRGIQKASEIRVAEVAEDDPWVRDVLSRLEGMNVPCAFEELLARWQAQYPEGPRSISSTGLPAPHAEQGWDGIRSDLMALGLIEVKRDGRIDMPDLYRVGFQLGRKGGVRPRNSQV